MPFIYLFFWLTIFLNHVIRKPIILDCFSLVGFAACIEIGKSYILIQNLTMHGFFNININNERLFVCASVAVLSHCRSCPCPFSKQTSSHGCTACYRNLHTHAHARTHARTHKRTQTVLIDSNYGLNNST